MKLSLRHKFILLLCLTSFCMGMNPLVSAQDKVWVGHNCEDAKALLDDTALEARKEKKTSIIVIARLGKRESVRGLNAKRLTPVMDYLRRKATNTLVSASGARVKGYGRLELYVAGKLLYVIAYPRNRLIYCGDDD